MRKAGMHYYSLPLCYRALPSLPVGVVAGIMAAGVTVAGVVVGDTTAASVSASGSGFQPLGFMERPPTITPFRM